LEKSSLSYITHTLSISPQTQTWPKNSQLMSCRKCLKIGMLRQQRDSRLTSMTTRQREQATQMCHTKSTWTSTIDWATLSSRCRLTTSRQYRTSATRRSTWQTTYLTKSRSISARTANTNRSLARSSLDWQMCVTPASSSTLTASWTPTTTSSRQSHALMGTLEQCRKITMTLSHSSRVSRNSQSTSEMRHRMLSIAIHIPLALHNDCI